MLLVITCAHKVPLLGLVAVPFGLLKALINDEWSGHQRDFASLQLPNEQNLRIQHFLVKTQPAKGSDNT